MTSHTSHQTITKSAVQSELREFMTRFAAGVERMYGNSTGGSLVGHPGSSARDMDPTEAVIEKSPLWTAVCDMYDYGLQGHKRGRLGKPEELDALYAETELFLLGLDSLSIYFLEDEVPSPWRAIRVVRTAVARHLLDGGTRYTDYEDANRETLSLSEMALLADMDERSVRNAANPKLANPLATENVGKRTVVSIEEARRWLAGRKGFVPTGISEVRENEVQVPLIDISLSSELAFRLTTQATASGLTVEDFIAQCINSNGSAS